MKALSMARDVQIKTKLISTFALVVLVFGLSVVIDPSKDAHPAQRNDIPLYPLAVRR